MTGLGAATRVQPDARKGAAIGDLSWDAMMDRSPSRHHEGSTVGVGLSLVWSSQAADEDHGDWVAEGEEQTLTSLLAMVQNSTGSPVEYEVGGQKLQGEERERVAQMLADDAMQVRCGPSPTLERWRARRDGGPPESGSRREVVAVYAGIGFGLPADPAIDDHLQGLVAELLWNRLMLERTVCRDGRRLVHAHQVKADPLEPGGDGLVIYQVDPDVLVFRLWEIKKHQSQNQLSATIGRASKQLASRGQEYLAKLAGPETVGQAGPLGAFYADLVELWLDGSERTGVGVSVGTSREYAPVGPRSFGSLTTAFPHLSRPGQVESIVVAVPEFPAFAARVREIVWSGL